MKIAAIYTRKSKFTGKGESIENQVKLCKDYLQRLNISEFLIYEDEGFSGKNSERPEFQKMLKDAKKKKFDVVICYRLDRMSRNVADFSSIIQELEKYSISFVSVAEQFDTTTPMGRAMMYIASVFAQLERETIAERIKDNMLELAKSGRWLGGNTPTGFKSTPITFIDSDFKERKLFELSPIEEELKLIKLIYDKYTEFKSLGQVEKYLLSNNIKTKLGTDWSKIKIHRMLTNAVYVKATDEVLDYLESKGITAVGTPDGIHGMLTYNKRNGNNGYKDVNDWISAVSRHLGIIEANLWLEIQKTLEKNKEKAPRLGKTNIALLTGILKCAECGSHMQITYGSKNKKTETRTYYYACSLKVNSGGTRCKNKNIRGDRIESLIVDKLKNFTVDKGKLIEELVNHKKQLASKYPTVDETLDIKASINQNKNAVQNLINTLSLTQDSDTSKLLLEKIQQLNKENERLNIKLQEVKDSISSTKGELLNIDIVMESLKNFSSLINICNNQEKRILIGSIIDEIYWDSRTGEIEMCLLGTAKKKSIPHC